jgi:hypothetical protein
MTKCFRSAWYDEAAASEVPQALKAGFVEIIQWPTSDLKFRAAG